VADSVAAPAGVAIGDNSAARSNTEDVSARFGHATALPRHRPLPNRRSCFLRAHPSPLLPCLRRPPSCVLLPLCEGGAPGVHCNRRRCCQAGRERAAPPGETSGRQPVRHQHQHHAHQTLLCSLLSASLLLRCPALPASLLFARSPAKQSCPVQQATGCRGMRGEERASPSREDTRRGRKGGARVAHGAVFVRCGPIGTGERRAARPSIPDALSRERLTVTLG
jgi:hypothetical protein